MTRAIVTFFAAAASLFVLANRPCNVRAIDPVEETVVIVAIGGDCS